VASVFFGGVQRFFNLESCCKLETLNPERLCFLREPEGGSHETHDRVIENVDDQQRRQPGHKNSHFFIRPADDFIKFLMMLIECSYGNGLKNF